MKINHFLQLIILFLCLIWNYSTQASSFTPEEAKKWAENKGQEIIQILTGDNTEQKYTDLDNILYNDIDLDHAAKFVMGKYWRQMNDAQKERYTKLFKDYTRSIYQGYNLQLDKGAISFHIDKAVKNEDTIEVFCTILIEKLEKNVDNESRGGVHAVFILVKNNNHIQVRDLKIEESSFLLSYRQRFYKMIHEDSDDEIDWFLDDLATIIKDNFRKNEDMY